MATQAKDLRTRAIEAAKAGDKDKARALLQQSLRLEPDNESAWMWLATVSVDPRERLFSLQRLLEINPQHETARKALNMLQPSAAVAMPSVEPDVFTTPVAVPMPSVEQIAAAQRQAEALVRDYLVANSARPGNVTWIRKSQRRAFDRDRLKRGAQVAVAGLIALGIIVGAVAVFIANDAETRALVMAPTPTASFTATPTPTATPGPTTTPSPTPGETLTPSATVPPDIRAYDPSMPLRPTEPYPHPESIQLRNAVGMMSHGDALQALPTLAVEREAVKDLFNPVPYYYEAIAQAQAGQDDAALQTLRDAEDRLTTSTENAFRPVINAGYAVVYAQLAASALQERRSRDANNYLQQAQSWGRSALQDDPRNVDVYLALSRAHALSGNLDEAMDVVDQGLVVPDLHDNANLLVQKGELYFAQRDYDQAMYQAFLALYTDPIAEPAYQLRVRAALAKDQPGLAVAYLEQYLSYFRGSAVAYKLLGDARLQEDNSEAALAAYTQALTPDEDTPATLDALLSRAQIYNAAGRYTQALDDLTRAYDLSNDPQIEAQRMDAAYRAGRYSVALADADALAGKHILPEVEIDLLRARILVDDVANPDANRLRDALQLLADVTDVSDDQLAVRYEYTARAHYVLGNYANSLDAVGRSLALDDTPERHYLRALILEASDRPTDAIREYEWAVSWGQVYPLPFQADAQTRLAALRGTFLFDTNP